MDPGSGFRTVDASGDRGLAALAARQHGVVALRQLEAIGFSRWAVQRRERAAQLHRLYRGVYAVGHTHLSLRGRWMAAVLACAEAVLSHHAAAALWQLRPPPAGRLIDVTAPGRRRQVGIRCHTVRSLPQRDRATIDAIPVTGLGRTLLDLAEVTSPQRLRSTLEAAQRLDLLVRDPLDALIARTSGRRGLKPLTEALTQLGDEAPWTQSELERRFLELIREAGLPEPRCNVVVAGVVVDFCWPAQRLVTEVDGHGFHQTRRSFEDDRCRDARLQIEGVRVVRITHRRIAYESRALLEDVDRLLGSARYQPHARHE